MALVSHCVHGPHSWSPHHDCALYVCNHMYSRLPHLAHDEHTNPAVDGVWSYLLV